MRSRSATPHQRPSSVCGPYPAPSSQARRLALASSRLGAKAASRPRRYLAASPRCTSAAVFGESSSLNPSPPLGVDWLASVWRWYPAAPASPHPPEVATPSQLASALATVSEPPCCCRGCLPGRRQEAAYKLVGVGRAPSCSAGCPPSVDKAAVSVKPVCISVHHFYHHGRLPQPG